MTLSDSLKQSLGLEPSPSLVISLNQKLVLLYPPNTPSKNPHIIPTDDSILSGLITLHLPKTKCVPYVVVKIIGKAQIVQEDFSWDNEITLEKEITLTLPQPTLVKGSHSFAFSLIIPATTPPSDRSIYGRIIHNVVAVAPGLGLFNQDLKASEEVHLVVAPNERGNISVPMEHWCKGFHDQLGNYSLSVTAEDVVMSSPLSLSFISDQVPSSKAHLTISILEQTTIDGARKPQRELILDRIPLQQVFLLHSARLPNCSQLQPSTHFSTISPPSKVKHALKVYLEIEDANSLGPQSIKLLKTPIKISLCICHSNSLVPPSYTKEHDQASLHKQVGEELICACNSVSALPSNTRSSLDLITYNEVGHNVIEMEGSRKRLEGMVNCLNVDGLGI